MAAALPLVVIMEKGAEAAEALNVTEIFYNRVADHIRNQPDAARSHAFDKQRMYELIQALDGWADLDAQERSRRNKEIGNNRAYKMCKKFCVLDIAGERALVDLVHAPGDGPPVHARTRRTRSRGHVETAQRPCGVNVQCVHVHTQYCV